MGVVPADNALKSKLIFQSQGYLENFADPCDDIITWLDDMISHNTAFAEGWGLYAENPLLPEDLDLYKDNKLEEFGMIKWQVMSLRILVKTYFIYKPLKTQITRVGEA